MRSNGLRPVAELMESEAVLLVRPDLSPAQEAVADDLRVVMRERDRGPRQALPDAERAGRLARRGDRACCPASTRRPCCRSPAPGMHAVHAVVDRRQVVELLGPLRAPAPAPSWCSRSRTWCRDPPRPRRHRAVPLAGGLGGAVPDGVPGAPARPEHASRGRRAGTPAPPHGWPRCPSTRTRTPATGRCARRWRSARLPAGAGDPHRRRRRGADPVRPARALPGRPGVRPPTPLRDVENATRLAGGVLSDDPAGAG